MNIMVTGGSRGIGKNIVLNAVKQGHDVAFTYHQCRDGAEQILAAAKAINSKVNCRFYQLDLKSDSMIETVIDEMSDHFDTMDALIANAGINKNNLAFTMSNEEWNEVIAVNLTGSFYLARHILPIFLDKKAGRFVFISSIAKDGISGQVNYSASKAGLIGLSGALAKEYGPKGIASNVVVPGFVQTDMTDTSMTERLKEFWKTFCPFHRVGTPDEIAAVILFLASERAAFVNGQVINVTGGLDWCY
jgi:3-oxoacyl-[acyl-carrier protein] reductase